MRTLVALVLALHGIAHWVGFRAAFWPTSIPLRRLVRLPRQLEGVVWLLLGVGFLAVAALILAEHDGYRQLLLGCLVVSLAMCIAAWPDARIGLVIDAGLLVLTLVSWPTRAGSTLTGRLARELESRGVSAPALPGQLVEARDLATLPPAARRYLTFMRVVGRPRDVSLRASFSGRFRRDPTAWLACEAQQYDTRAPVTRVFMMQLALQRVLPVTVRDEYLRGRGSLEAKAFDLLRVAEGRGYELDVGELVTYLNDAILMAPSLILGPETSWTEVDRDSFDVALTDAGTTVKARVVLDARGAPLSFSTTDRFFDAPDGRKVRTEWRTPIAGWQEAFGRMLPTSATAVWQLPSGPFAYAEFAFEPGRIAFNVPPG
jgi:hypothetical protein